MLNGCGGEEKSEWKEDTEAGLTEMRRLLDANVVERRI